MIVTDFSEGDHPPALPSARTLERFVITAAAAIPLRGDVSVLLTSDRGIRRLNRQYRGKNKPTDVLSFSAAAPLGKRQRHVVAGDLAISVDMATRQALAMDHPVTTELKVLILHGMLHLAGFDHEKDTGEMAARELLLRRTLRLPVGLIERTSDASRTLSPSSRKISPSEKESASAKRSRSLGQASLSKKKTTTKKPSKKVRA